MNSTATAKSFPGLTGSNPRVHSLHLPILILTFITAGAHFYLAAQPDEELHFYFLLNGIGYLVLLSAFLVPAFNRFHKSVRWILIGYTALTIILWFFLGSPAEGELDPFDLVVKAAEAALIIYLWLDKKRDGLKAQ